MKEIDLLPEWYKSDRRRQFGYRTQYVALAGVFVIMLVWNFLTARAISKSAAGLIQTESAQTRVETALREFGKIENEVAHLQKQGDVLDEIDARIDVPGILAEMSFLIDKKVVLSKVQFQAEQFETRAKNTPNNAANAAVVRVPKSAGAGDQRSLLGSARFKIVINGIASDAGDVAQLICQLEDSPYFCHVILSYSRPQRLKGGIIAVGRHQVSEFEITCYLANYRQEKPDMAQDSPNKRQAGSDAGIVCDLKRS